MKHKIIPESKIDSLIDAVRLQAAERPQSVYRQEGDFGPRCKYEATATNPCGCIIGAAARAIGESLDGQAHAVSHHLPAKLLRVGDDYRGEWLSKVQWAQDQGAAWSRAVKMADEMYPLAAR